VPVLMPIRRRLGLGRLMRRRHVRPRTAVIPVAMAPDPARLMHFPGEEAMPPEIRDRQLLVDAVAWAEERIAARSTIRLPSEGFHRRRDRERRTRGPIVNVLFVSHCDFKSNSAFHVYAVASELHRRGLSPAVAVPENAESVRDIGSPPFPVASYADVREGRSMFPDGRGPDLVHAFTPRELVREFTVELVREHGCPYVVHLEDNEETILTAELGGVGVQQLLLLPAPWLDRIIGPRQAHPLRAPQFLEHAAGVTVVIDRLLELKPEHVPGVVVRAGFDEAVLSPRRARDEVRAELRVTPDDLVIAYTGNIHAANLDEMRSLYLAIEQLRRDGRPIVLVKTGWGWPDVRQFPKLGEGIRELGWVARDSVPDLLAAADLLVQPGKPGPFNDYRFPSKLPEFLASGRPVVLPRTNIGLELRDGIEALVLERGDTPEIHEAVLRLADDADLRAKIGEQGREFALRELRWGKSVDEVEKLYGEIAANNPPPVPAWALDGIDPPVKLIAIVPRLPTTLEARAARAHGIYGFCVGLDTTADALDARGALEFPICFRIAGSDTRAEQTIPSALSLPGYIHVDGAPLLLADDLDTVAWCEREAVGLVHVALVRGSDVEAAAPGFDSAVETPQAATSAESFDGFMQGRLAVPLPDYSWFRSIAFPPEAKDEPAYAVWLRKLVLQTLYRAPSQEPLIFVNPADAWTQPSRHEGWLAATQAGLRDGIRQFYASQHLEVRGSDADEMLSMT
jgi:glycosyltransferase involved in cell wall biosynthesis